MAGSPVKSPLKAVHSLLMAMAIITLGNPVISISVTKAKEATVDIYRCPRGPGQSAQGLHR